MKLCVIILTKNEQPDLLRCLDALRGWAPISIVDSGSVDRTMEIAESAGATVFSNTFSSFGQQRNWAIDHCGMGSEWLLFLDADEVATPAFFHAVDAAIKAADRNVAGFYCCWKLMLFDRWLRRCDSFPKWQFRVVRRGRARFADYGHGQKEGEVDGGLDYIREPYLHYAFSKGWSAWMERHNRYSTMEAQERLKHRASLRELFATQSASLRNKALKPLLSRIPGWPLLRFIADYVLRLGFLEGRAGLVYCLNMAYYEYLIQLKMREIRDREETALRP